MNKRTKIIIAGIGGVGGYFGGLLAKAYSESHDIDICFLARGEHLAQIRKNGLKVIEGETQFIAKPRIASDNAVDMGLADYIILCTKSYDLEKTIEQLKPCIHDQTAFLPLLNGVDSAEKIKLILPSTTVFNGCVYIVALIKEAGVVANVGNLQKLFFGIEDSSSDQLDRLVQLFKQAGIESTRTKNISSVLWEKFHLVGANSTATSYYENSTGEILADRTKCEFLISLLNEVNQIALAKGIVYDNDMVSATLEKLKSLPFETTSSMQRDFQRPNAQTELETIAGFVVREGQLLNMETPTFRLAYETLLRRSNPNA